VPIAASVRSHSRSGSRSPSWALGDDLFGDIWLTAAAKRLARFFEGGTHRPSVIGSEYRLSNKGKGSSHGAPFAFRLGALLVSQPPVRGEGCRW
jgi:hypothetical protein